MAGTSTSIPEVQPQSSSVTNVSGGIKFAGDGDVDVGGDVVGGNKTESAAGDIIHASIVIINKGGEYPATNEKKPAPLVLKRQDYEPEMLLISAGSFLMGNQPGPGIKQAESPQHEVILSDFYIGKYPITNREYAEFIKQAPNRNPPKVGWSGRKPPAEKLDHPVVNVSWYDAVAYCKWLRQYTHRTYRLPTEAEWEKAARGTAGRIYPWGNDWVDNLCNAAAGDNGDTMPVTAHGAGASPFCCEDILGNVEEWTNTLWSTNDREYAYPYKADDGREDPDDNQDLFRPQRVHRGGSFRDPASNLRCSARGHSGQDIAVKWRGFRVVLVEP